MNIRNVLEGSRIRTRPIRGEPDIYQYIVRDNYWNRIHRLCENPLNGCLCEVPTIDIDQVLAPVSGGGMDWLPVTLTPAQEKRRKFQRMVEYNTSPESEAYWCS
jgi:hypothetical protein